MRTAIIMAATASLLAASVSPSFSDDTQPADPAMSDMKLDKATWTKVVAGANFFEIESSKVALEKSASKDVKAFAQQMIDDHTKAGEKLASVLKGEGMPLPPRDLSPKQATAMEMLKSAEGKEFDAAYVQVQTDAHVGAVSLFKAYAANPDDAALGAFAKETLPTLEKHLEHVKMLAK